MMDMDNSFSFEYNAPHHFVTSQWRFKNAFLIWRGFWFFWNLAWLINSIQVEVEISGCALKWLLYLTNWSYTLLLLQSFVHFSAVVYHRSKGETKKEHFKDKMGWHHKLLWLLTDVSFDAAMVVTVMYWTLEHKELKYTITIINHLVNTVYVVSDLLIVASPVRFDHVLYTCIYAAIYGLFSVLYQLGGGTNSLMEPYIYSSLDWSKPGPTAALALGVVFPAMFVVHLFQFLLYKLRLLIWSRVSCGGRENFKDD